MSNGNGGPGGSGMGGGFRQGFGQPMEYKNQAMGGNMGLRSPFDQAFGTRPQTGGLDPNYGSPMTNSPLTGVLPSGGVPAQEMAYTPGAQAAPNGGFTPAPTPYNDPGLPGPSMGGGPGGGYVPPGLNPPGMDYSPPELPPWQVPGAPPPELPPRTGGADPLLGNFRFGPYRNPFQRY